MTLIIAGILAIIAVALAAGVTLDYMLNRRPRARRRHGLTADQIEQLYRLEHWND